MRRALLFLFVILMLAALTLGRVDSITGCGIKPIKPIVPVGCKDLIANCICVEGPDHLQHCHWEWLCVPR